MPDAGTLEEDVVRGSSTVVDVYGRKVRGHIAVSTSGDSTRGSTVRQAHPYTHQLFCPLVSGAAGRELR